jgi:hypothetical protein
VSSESHETPMAVVWVMLVAGILMLLLGSCGNAPLERDDAGDADAGADVDYSIDAVECPPFPGGIVRTPCPGGRCAVCDLPDTNGGRAVRCQSAGLYCVVTCGGCP